MKVRGCFLHWCMLAYAANPPSAEPPHLSMYFPYIFLVSVLQDSSKTLWLHSTHYCRRTEKQCFRSSLMNGCCWWTIQASSKETEGCFSELPKSRERLCVLVRAQLYYPVKVSTGGAMQDWDVVRKRFLYCKFIKKKKRKNVIRSL